MPKDSSACMCKVYKVQWNDEVRKMNCHWNHSRALGSGPERSGVLSTPPANFVRHIHMLVLPEKSQISQSTDVLSQRLKQLRTGLNHSN